MYYIGDIMKKSKGIYLTVTSLDMEKIKEMRDIFDINTSAFFRESLRKKYSQLKKKANDNS